MSRSVAQTHNIIRKQPGLWSQGIFCTQKCNLSLQDLFSFSSILVISNTYHTVNKVATLTGFAPWFPRPINGDFDRLGVYRYLRWMCGYRHGQVETLPWKKETRINPWNRGNCPPPRFTIKSMDITGLGEGVDSSIVLCGIPQSA